MSLTVTRFDIEGVVQLVPRRFADGRGFFVETYNAKAFRDAGIDCVFVQDNSSRSAERGTVRGLHFQAAPHAQDKLIRVVSGAILDVAVDLRENSPSYGRHVAVTLTGAEGQQLFIPKGFAHGFCTLEPDTEVAYKVSDFYAPAAEGGIIWNDPALGIAWPDFAGAQVAVKDRTHPTLKEFADRRTP